jgi:hypothetical protein
MIDVPRIMIGYSDGVATVRYFVTVFSRIVLFWNGKSISSVLSVNGEFSG